MFTHFLLLEFIRSSVTSYLKKKYSFINRMNQQGYKKFFKDVDDVNRDG